MKPYSKSSQNRGSVIRPILAALLMLGGVALLARAGGPGGSAAPAAPSAVTASPGVPRFQNYPAPPGIADSVGEPSIGCNWKSETSNSNSMFSIPNGGRVMLFGGFSPDLYRATFDDCSSPAKPLWEAKPLLTASTPRAAGDPILFTDHTTGRTFVSQLEGLTPAGSTTDITDDDGDNFMPSEGSSLPSDVDHETFGGGIFHAGALGPVTAYPNAVYYASQSVSDARATLSQDGGVTFGPAFPMYTINDCAGLHGHIKVSPKDGTVYVPNVACGGAVPFHETGGKQAAIVSEDNGITWNIRPIPDSTTHGNGSADNTIIGTRDPSVSIDADGNVYFVYQAEDRLTAVTDPADQAGDTHPKVAVSHDHGVTWSPSIDVGANVINGAPVKNATFVTATAGSSGRAAVAFFGTETGGNNWSCGEGDDCSLSAQGVSTGMNARKLFTGVWYLYISTTFDGGKTWTTQNVTPGDPIQRGGICGGSTCRNLLDFMDLQIDKEGRILVAGEDGCIGACVNGGPNSFTAKGFITRQSGGKRMLAQFDPAEPLLAGAPLLSATMDNDKLTVQLSWPIPDNGGSDITGYNVYRRIGSGSFTLLGSTTSTNFTDITFDKNQTNSYRVTAVNGIGEGPFCHDVVPILLPPPENLCLPPGVKLLTDPAGDTSAALGFVNTPAPPGADLLRLQVVQPFATDGVVKLYFLLQTDVGQSPQPPASAWYVSMKTPDGKVHGVHMAWKGPTPSFESYIATPNSGGTTDGRFVDPASVKPLEPESKYEPQKGLVTLVVKVSDLGLTPGSVISGFNAAVTQSTDVASIGKGGTATYDEMPNGLLHTGSFNFGGNAVCAPNLPPTAKLAATPVTGNPPLTVNFDASASVDPDPGDSVTSYTFSFGDGSPDVTQSTPTISHTFKHGGDFFVTLTVKDSHGLQSANTASADIQVAAQLLNLSTRLRVQPGDNALIGGFIIRGSEQKKVILRGIGPSLNVPGKLDDPVIQLFNSAGVNIAGNDDWKTDQQNVEATGLAPTNDRESAIVIVLDPGAYTVVMRGKNNSSGVGVVEMYDIGLAANARLANVSSRGFIGTGDNVLIGGFFAGPQTAAVTGVVFRAIGPSLAAFGVPQPLQDPTIEIHNGNGDVIASNDDWQTNQKTEIQATGLAPSDSRESAILMRNFDPGPYTAIVRGKGNTTGVGLVEIYDVQQ
jgi:PKD domain-containing protein/fibronectin type III domain protein